MAAQDTPGVSWVFYQLVFQEWRIRICMKQVDHLLARLCPVAGAVGAEILPDINIPDVSEILVSIRLPG